MKKIIIIAGCVLLVSVTLIILLTRSTEKTIVNRNLPCALNPAYRSMIIQDNWRKWTQGEFSISKPLLNSAEIETKEGDKGLMLLVFKNIDTTTVHWEMHGNGNNFFKHKKLNQMMNAALDSLAQFVTDTKNTYGMALTEGSTTDTNLVATRFVSPSYPSNEYIYTYIEQLRKFVTHHHTSEVSHPMINITAEYDGSYKCMVALPVSKKITTPQNNPIFFTRMVPAKFLIAEVKGGTASVKEAHKMIEDYLRDYQRTAMAIPFDYLITDRIHETDTTKWITRIYTPVF